MKNNTITLGLIIILGLFFLIYFTTLNQVASDNDINGLIDRLEQAATNEEWEKSEELKTLITQRWRVLDHLITLNFGEQDYSNLVMSLDKLDGGIKGKDVVTVLSQTGTIKELLKNILRVIPRP